MEFLLSSKIFIAIYNIIHLGMINLILNKFTGFTYVRDTSVFLCIIFPRSTNLRISIVPSFLLTQRGPCQNTQKRVFHLRRNTNSIIVCVCNLMTVFLFAFLHGIDTTGYITLSLLIHVRETPIIMIPNMKFKTFILPCWRKVVHFNLVFNKLCVV